MLPRCTPPRRPLPTHLAFIIPRIKPVVFARPCTLTFALRHRHLFATASATVPSPPLSQAGNRGFFSTSTSRYGKKDSDHEVADPNQGATSKEESKDKPSKRQSTSGTDSEQAAVQPTVEEATSRKDSGAASEDKPNNAAAGGLGSGSVPGPSPGPSAGSGPGGDGSGKRGRKSTEKSLQKPMVPEVYPQVLAIPITKRPLFPGFYKAITIKDTNVANAIAEMLKCGQPYIGAFLAKNEDDDQDVIHNVEDVHDVGVFAQITSAIPVRGQEGALTAIIYPHRRIRLSGLIRSDVKAPLDDDVPAETVEVPEPIPSKSSEESQAQDKVQDQKGDVVASFEEGAVQEKPARKQQQQHYDPISFLRRYPVSLVNVENLVDKDYDPKSAFIRAVTSEIVNVFKEVARMNPLFRDQVATLATSQSTGNVTAEPGRLADFAAAVSSGDQTELQEILACMDIEERMQKSLTVLKKDLMNAELQSRITKDVETKINKRQREYWLMEQMKGIRRELGLESDGKDKLVEKFKAKADSLAMPEAVRKVFDEEINKLAHLETAASEFNVTRNYLDWLTQIPWGLRSTENFNIQNAIKVLDEDHYGLEDVKDRILEFIAVGKLRGTVEGKILCFVGPPGVGKTSIGKSIARALNRQYYRFSVGGLTDVAEIKGHRRTYVGALPGRIIQALKKCQTENPLILIDEVDKIGRGWQGDPSSSLLELLDPEQNGSFLDHYMDVPVDLSRVLFVCTANMTDTIPQPLLDRMEIITLSGYVSDDKMKIAEKYLAPAAKETAGLKKANVNLTNEAIEELIKSYCRESGVRNLKKQIEKVFRKSALKIVKDLGEEVLPEEAALTDEGKEALKNSSATPAEMAADAEAPSEDDKISPPLSPLSSSLSSTSSSSSPSSSTSSPSLLTTLTDTSQTETSQTSHIPRVALEVPASVHIEIGSDNLKDYVGPPVFTSDRLYDVNPAGVAMGLAWTQMGGAAMYVESIMKAPLRPGTRPELDITGNLKQVMKESSNIAYSFAKSFMAKEFPENHFFDRAKLHLHVPDGAVPKDGPSAGITMATSLLSLGLETAVNPALAMTGELTLTGKVLRIGGLREKTVAARRVGCSMIIFPKDNMSDWLELPENIREGIEGRPVDWYSEIFDLVFPKLDKERANKCKACQWKKENEQVRKKKTASSRQRDEEEDDDE